MKLTNYSDYALRILIYLGLKREKLSTITEISDCYRISRNHVVKIVHHLGQLGYLDTLRGKHGGIRLARAPEMINIGEVMRHTEASMDLVECFSDQNACIICDSCVLRSIIAEALAAFMTVLDSYTLADLMVPKRQLKKQLQTMGMFDNLTDQSN
ncbi:transcriptional regulator, BadM/Rrf2 family [Nitrosomonas eutropha]|uniref:Transcriptional regulator, BadM/Rrf2 family n=1 Tax=Nitrosomonas eutropha TaxID=916 RepID=A0A1I7G0T8_9PROT|nr:Rrf2 family transcriptional regulator [Nitrosomonas eutropha]SFU42055.1 transcriptional regulator, BadM/Rrf2 family [Nitrosomonas eutropha]